MSDTTQIVTYWDVDDVIARAEKQGINLTREQAGDVLDLLVATFDADIGICWATIDAAFQTLKLTED